MSSECEGKSSWPELDGKVGVDVVETIEAENPNVTAKIVLEGTKVTMQFLCTRVRVWVDETGIITRVPRIG